MQSKILLWRQLWAIAALLAAIVVSFIIYGFYQGPILRNLGLSGWVSYLPLLQGLMGSLVEPLVGAYSDHLRRRYGSRLPQIALGVTLAALIFVLLAFLIPTSLAISLRWLLVLLMVFWVGAMMIFRGPVLALLCQLAPSEQLPIANSILVLVLGLVGAGTPALEQLLLKLQPANSFLLGSFLLVLAGVVLVRNFPYRCNYQQYLGKKLGKSHFKVFLGLFLAGLAVGSAINLVLVLIPYRLSLVLQGWTPATINSMLLLLAALVSFPVSQGLVRERITEKKALLIGLGAMAILMGLSWLNHSHLGGLSLLMLLGAMLGLILTEQIPLTVAAVFPAEVGLSTGLYLGGIGMGTAIIAFGYGSPITVSFSTAMEGMAIAIALACFSLFKLLKPPKA